MNKEQEGQGELTFSAAVQAFFERASQEEFEAGIRRHGKSVCDALRKLGYRFKNEMGDDQELIETWINNQREMGVMLHWFRL
jgi:transposase